MSATPFTARRAAGIAGVLLFFLITSGWSQESAPVPVQAALFLKLLAFDTKLSGAITVHVVKSAEFAAEFKKGVGKPIGTATLGAVTEGTDVPADAAAVVYCGDEGLVDKVKAYCTSKQALSITGLPALVARGLSLGIGLEAGKPKILINLAASKAEGVEWNPAILKLATTVK